MATIKCPSCRRMLNLPPALRGTLVQCPACGTTFPGPAEEEPTVAVSPHAQSRSPRGRENQGSAPPEPASRRSPFDVRDEAEETAYNRLRKKVQAAASRLRLAVLFDALSSITCCPCFSS